MTKKDKELLIQDLCTRLPYGFIIYRPSDNANLKISDIDDFAHFLEYSDREEFKPYLRPMSSMTEEELKILKYATDLIYDQLELVFWPDGSATLEFYLEEVPQYCIINVFDWLNKNHFDYRGLIPMGLALEAPEDMYNTKIK